MKPWSECEWRWRREKDQDTTSDLHVSDLGRWQETRRKDSKGWSWRGAESWKDSDWGITNSSCVTAENPVVRLAPMTVLISYKTQNNGHCHLLTMDLHFPETWVSRLSMYLILQYEWSQNHHSWRKPRRREGPTQKARQSQTKELEFNKQNHT